MPTPFISRQDLTDRIGRDVTADDGALACVDAACDIVRNEAEQTFNEVTDDTVTLDGTGTDALLLPQGPVIEVSSVAEDDTAVTDYTLRDSGVLLKASGVWRRARNNIEVIYSHGYDGDDLPRDVRMVALTLAERLFLQGPAIFEVLGARQVRYAGSAADLTAGEKAILRKYRVTKQPWATIVAS